MTDIARQSDQPAPPAKPRAGPEHAVPQPENHACFNGQPGTVPAGSAGNPVSQSGPRPLIRSELTAVLPATTAPRPAETPELAVLPGVAEADPKPIAAPKVVTAEIAPQTPRLPPQQQPRNDAAALAEATLDLVVLNPVSPASPTAGGHPALQTSAAAMENPAPAAVPGVSVLPAPPAAAPPGAAPPGAAPPAAAPPGAAPPGATRADADSGPKAGRPILATASAESAWMFRLAAAASPPQEPAPAPTTPAPPRQDPASGALPLVDARQRTDTPAPLSIRPTGAPTAPTAPAALPADRAQHPVAPEFLAIKLPSRQSHPAVAVTKPTATAPAGKAVAVGPAAVAFGPQPALPLPALPQPTLAQPVQHPAATLPAAVSIIPLPPPAVAAQTSAPADPAAPAPDAPAAKAMAIASSPGSGDPVRVEPAPVGANQGSPLGPDPFAPRPAEASLYLGTAMVLRLAQTAALASPLPPVPAFSPEFPANLAATVTSADRDRVEVSLDPVELGRLRFDIRHNGDLVQVNLSVERPETMDLMRRHADQLLAELRAAGFAGASLSFSQWGQGQADKSKPDAPPPPETAAPNGPVPAPTIPLRAAQTGQGLDLRL